MPKIKAGRKKPPKGFEEIEEKLESFEEEMRSAELNTNTTKKDALWSVHRINNKRSRYVYELYYEDNIISKELYNYLLKYKYADPLLIAKWKKPGYSNLCCLLCISKLNSEFGGVCVCRVPAKKSKNIGEIQCNHCGCRGCS